MVNIKQLLKRLGSKVKKNTADISALEDYCSSFDYVRETKNTTVSSGTTYYKSGTLTLPKKGLYLVLNGVDATVSAPNSYLVAAVNGSSDYGASNINVIMAMPGLSTMANGGAVTGWALVEALADDAVVASSSYKYYSGTYTHRNRLLAIRIPIFSKV